MINNPFEDETHDACDEARGRDIQRLRQVPVFTPHCPECYSGNIFFDYGQNGTCGNCFVFFNAPVYLRPLPPSPAPPYTQEEINELADLNVLASVWWTLNFQREATV